ncbi:MAG: hypothetical protein KME30_12605 [Iphinoe sp. HA4291-MV1]|jgi:hypothetical protein|nr:hypothetical protein [Iphinoe sp. HA4291-MV1]
MHQLKQAIAHINEHLGCVIGALYGQRLQSVMNERNFTLQELLPVNKYISYRLNK